MAYSRNSKEASFDESKGKAGIFREKLKEIRNGQGHGRSCKLLKEPLVVLSKIRSHGGDKFRNDYIWITFFRYPSFGNYRGTSIGTERPFGKLLPYSGKRLFRQGPGDMVNK